MAADPKSMDALVEDLRKRRERLMQGGGPDRLAKHREQGKLTARERIDALADPGSFEELGLFARHRQTAGSSTSPARTSRCSAGRPGRSTPTRSRT
jgi:acetyl-CoA carboxylase carboxyltransferase component